MACRNRSLRPVREIFPISWAWCSLTCCCWGSSSDWCPPSRKVGDYWTARLRKSGPLRKKCRQSSSPDAARWRFRHHLFPRGYKRWGGEYRSTWQGLCGTGSFCWDGILLVRQRWIPYPNGLDLQWHEKVARYRWHLCIGWFRYSGIPYLVHVFRWVHRNGKGADRYMGDFLPS